jgi:1-acyl-sn-glycerol-3-phosphate acyltransferase
MVWLFSRIFERTLRKGFYSVRLANRPAPHVFQSPQLVIFTNHPSWWDGVTYLFLADRLLAGRKVFTPVDAEMSARYGFLQRVGAFGIEQGTRRGALDFIEACKIVLTDTENAMIIAAQGRFADCRLRPLRLEPGIAHLAKIAPAATYLPLAIEYTHWLEKSPELLLRFGTPILPGSFAGLNKPSILEKLEEALTDTMDVLAQSSIARDQKAFENVLSGEGGVNRVYDLWRRVLALARGRSFNPDHGASP